VVNGFLLLVGDGNNISVFGISFLLLIDVVVAVFYSDVVSSISFLFIDVVEE